MARTKYPRDIEFKYAVGEGWSGWSEGRCMAEMFLRWVAAGRPGEESAEVDHSPIGRFYAQRKIACARKRSGSTTYYRNTKGERIKLVHELRRRQLRKAA